MQDRLDGLTKSVRVDIEDLEQEGIRMRGLDLVSGQDAFREILQVDRHEETGLALDRGGQDVAIIGIRQGQGRDQSHLASHDTRHDMQIHQPTGTL